MSYDPERIFRDLLADALCDGSARQWRRRAEVFRAARPTPQDHPGQRSVDDLRTKWHSLSAVADACEARARFIEGGRQDWPDLDAVVSKTFEREEAA